MKSEIIGGVLFVVALFSGISVAFNVPVVYKSHSTGECTKVIGNGDCFNLPKRYNLVWVR